MELNRNIFATPNLETTIDRHPLIIAPETPLQKAIAMMSQAWGSSCLLETQKLSVVEDLPNRVSSSCA